MLLINPNTTASITALVLAEARKAAAPGTEIAAVTARFGAAYIGSRAAYAIAGHGALDAYAEHGAGYDAVVLACFGDPGLAGLKELATVPVIGMAEAACHQAALLGGRFAIVTGGERWRAMLAECVAGMGLSDRLSGIVTVTATGADIARDPEGSADLLAEACRAAVEDGADTIILGGAGLAGIAPRIRDRVSVPLIDGLVSAVKAAEAAVAQHVVKARSGSMAPTPPVGSVGLSQALTERLSGGVSTVSS
jgi:Asp/Glu/hydantoin racemase